MPRPKEFEHERRLAVKLEKDLHDAAKHRATKEGKSLSEAVRDWLTRWTGEDPPKK